MKAIKFDLVAMDNAATDAENELNINYSDEVLSKPVKLRLRSGEKEVVLKSYNQAVDRLESLKKAGCSPDFPYQTGYIGRH